MSSILYRISSVQPEAHLWDVQIDIPAIYSAQGLHLRLPNWIPGSYMIRDFARHIVEITARDTLGSVSLSKLNKSTWVLDAAQGDVSVLYRVYAFDLSVRGAFLDLLHGFFNPSSLCLQLLEAENAACEMSVERPAVESCALWRCATGAQALEIDAAGFGRYGFDSYADLIDYPVQMGELVSLEFSAADVPHQMVFNQGVRLDKERLRQDMIKICEQHISLFGRPAPMSRYLFMTHVSSSGYGGLEHRNSTALMCAHDDLPSEYMGETASAAYQRFLGLCSHEYFHSWNVKRMTPAVLQQATLEEEVYTPLLWFFEGITSYYDDLALLRSGVIGLQEYLSLLGQTITRVWRGQGRFRQSVSASSFDAWTRFYKQDENAANAIVSYYSKGSLVALCLDLELRKRSQNRLSLDHLMRHLWQAYLHDQQGHHEQSWLHGLQQLMPGESWAEVQNWVEGTDDPPLQALLEQGGVQVHWRSRAGFKDSGGQAEEKTATVELGAIVAAEHERILIKTVQENGAAMTAGLSVGDELVALNGRRCGLSQIEQALQQAKAGEVWQWHVFRDHQMLHLPMTLKPAETTTCWLSCDEPAALWQGWLLNGASRDE